MNNQEIENAIHVLKSNFALKAAEKVLIITDDDLYGIAANFYEGVKQLGNEVVLALMPDRYQSGQEPPVAIASAMRASDVILCITNASLTHTRATKQAAQSGARIGTMPGITQSMMTEGAITADTAEIKRLCQSFTARLNQAEDVRIEKAGYCLEFSVKGRQGISSTGIFLNPGEYGNIPSGESYIAPLETSANGQLLVDGSIAEVGVVDQAVLLTIENGRLVDASGRMGKKLLELLGDGKGRTIAEFGIGTNKAARLTGNVLEDEKVYSTIHIAFGSNKPFGGVTEAGIHIDCVVKEPAVWLDEEKFLFD
ncbi:MAG TPA: aminopeptidase [Tetragenococcus sp.]|nr:aminopeptidase [Tetragenococcus sp.]